MLPQLANHQIRHKAISKVGSGACVGMHELTYSFYQPEGLEEVQNKQHFQF